MPELVLTDDMSMEECCEVLCEMGLPAYEGYTQLEPDHDLTVVVPLTDVDGNPIK